MYLPYDTLLPYTNVFISNGGYNGSMNGVVNGMPMLLVGTDADKEEVSARAEYASVAVNLRVQTPTEAQIREGVGKLLTEEGYKKRAVELKKENEKWTH